MLKIICGSCDQPATAHPITDSNHEFLIPCPRDPETIGLSLWTEDSPAYFHDITSFQGGEYVEALSVFDLGKKVVKTAASSDTISTEYQDYAIVDGVVTLNLDHSGTEAASGSDLMVHRDATNDYGIFGIGADEAPYVSQDSPSSESSKLDRWNDATHQVFGNTQSWTCTSVLGEAEGEYVLTQTVSNDTKSRSKTYLDPNNEIDKSQRNAYVEGNEGFISLSLLDEQLTRKYHEKLLNVFLDKQTQDVRIGSIRLIKNVDGTLTARCVNSTCGPNGRRASMTIAPNLATRTEMEDFVWAMVAHGNNHAANWFRSRPTFHKVHRLGCDINACDPNSVTCPPAKSAHAEELNEVEFLMEHQAHCKSKTCKCDDRLKELTFSMDVNSHIYQSAS